MDQNELPVEPPHQGVPSGSSKMISKAKVRLAQIVHLSCIQRTEMRFHMTHVTWEFHPVCPKWFLRLWYVWRKPCTYLASRLALSPLDQNELPVEPRDLGVPSGASKMISEPMICLVQTIHLSCTHTNNVSKQTKTRFHMTHVTY
jgi:hypothetical protein